jgi:alpha-ketoglutarate-dependent taurine dioxygenase
MARVQPFVREAMAPTFGTILRATRSGEHPVALPAHADELRQTLRESGAILLRGFDFDVAAFESFCSLFGDRALVHPGTLVAGRQRVTEATATVDSGVRPFPWHAELAYAPHRPGLLAFACERGSARGGETFVTDGCAIADGLSAAGRAVASRRVRYRYGRLEKTWATGFDGARTRGDVERVLREHASRLLADEGLTWSFGKTGVTMEYTTPMLSAGRWNGRPAFCNHVILQEHRRGDHARRALDPRRLLGPPHGVAFEDGSRIPVQAVTEFERLADEAAYAIDWRPGDVAIVDNTRVMHARGAVLDTSRRILARVFDAAP